MTNPGSWYGTPPTEAGAEQPSGDETVLSDAPPPRHAAATPTPPPPATFPDARPPAQTSGYAAPTTYPPATPSYPAQMPGYPVQTPGFPPATPGYPAQTPGFPAATPGFPAETASYPAPVTGYPAPVTGFPPAAAFAAPPKRGRGALVAVILLSILVVALLGVGGVVTKMYLDTSNQAADQQGRIRDLTTQVSDAHATIDKTQQDLNDAKEQLADSQKEAKAVADCLKAIDSAGRAAADGKHSESEITKLFRSADKTCQKADQYL